MSASLTLERTAEQVLALVVPRFAAWAALTLQTDHRWRQLSTDGADVLTRTVRVPTDVNSLHPLSPFPARTGGDPVAAMVLLGATAAMATEFCADAAVAVVTIELRAHGAQVGILALASRVAGPAAPALEENDLALLHELGLRASVALAAARVYEERTALARSLRAALVPPDLPSVPGVGVGACYRPAQTATELGGDFYDLFPVDDAWAFAIGDVCGRGVEAAVATGQARQSLRTATLADADPAEAIRLLNTAMLTADGTRFVTLVHGRLLRRPSGGLSLALAGGGHPPPLVLRHDGSAGFVKTGGTIVGMLPAARFTTTTLDLLPGETLLLYTDGVTEARGDGELLGPERLADALSTCGGMSAQAIVDRVEKLLVDWIGAGSHDDVALLALQAESGHRRLNVVREVATAPSAD